MIAFDKCNILHIGQQQNRQNYFFGNTVIPISRSVRDLGVIVSDDLKFHEHINNIVKKASLTANMIHRSFLNKSKQFLARTFVVFVRPKLEYASQIWNPVYVSDIKRLEQVQRRFTKRIPGLRYKSYQERLQILNLQSLELRRLQLDLSFLYKLLHGKLALNHSKFFVLKNSITRGHRWTLNKPRFRKDIRKHFFVNRVVDKWNSLPETVVTASSLAVFKKSLFKHDVKRKLCTFLKGGDFDSHD